MVSPPCSPGSIVLSEDVDTFCSLEFFLTWWFLGWDYLRFLPLSGIKLTYLLNWALYGLSKALSSTGMEGCVEWIGTVTSPPWFTVRYQRNANLMWPDWTVIPLIGTLSQSLKDLTRHPHALLWRGTHNGDSTSKFTWNTWIFIEPCSLWGYWQPWNISYDLISERMESCSQKNVTCQKHLLV